MDRWIRKIDRLTVVNDRRKDDKFLWLCNGGWVPVAPLHVHELRLRSSLDIRGVGMSNVRYGRDFDNIENEKKKKESPTSVCPVV